MKSDLQTLCEEADLEVRSYSGRFMYGKKCLAVDGDDALSIFGRLLATARQEDDETRRDQLLNALEEACGDCRTDQMGLGQVIYWPDISFGEVDEETDNWGEEDDDLPGI